MQHTHDEIDEFDLRGLEGRPDMMLPSPAFWREWRRDKAGMERRGWRVLLYDDEGVKKWICMKRRTPEEGDEKMKDAAKKGGGGMDDDKTLDALDERLETLYQICGEMDARMDALERRLALHARKHNELHELARLTAMKVDALADTRFGSGELN